MHPADTGPRIAYVTSLIIEVVVGIVLVVVLVERLDLDGFALVLPVGLIVGGLALVAFALRNRLLFWCGVLGATAGALCPKPPLYVTFRSDADPADVAVIWLQMIGETNFRYALAGAIVSVWSPWRLRKSVDASRVLTV